MIQKLGFDPVTVQQILGHADVHTTLKNYVHPSREARENAAVRLVEVYGPLRS
jgi:integrase